MQQTTVPSHITIDEKGVARIDGTRMKVIHLVEAWKSGFDSPSRLHEAYPDLTMAQIYAALSYYHDHQAHIDAEVERRLREFEAARLAAEETPGRKKLREQGLLP